MAYNKKHHFEENLAVIRRAFDLAKTGQTASPQDLALLKRYSGFGGLKCVLLPADNENDKRHWAKSELNLFPLVQELHRTLRENSADEREYKRYLDSIKNSALTAFYTPAEPALAIAQTLCEAGADPKTILEPSAGAGQFVECFKKALPECRITAYEKDLLTGKILSCIYPQESVHTAGFETISPQNEGRFDLVVSNIPFGDIAVADVPFMQSQDPARRQAARHIHNYFFVKGLDALREGGVMAFITSQGVADAPTNRFIREYLMANARLVSAVRLPNNLMEGTQVGSDLIILQKDSHKTGLTQGEQKFVETAKTKQGININAYIYDKANLIFTQSKIGKSLYRDEPAIELYHEGGATGAAEDLAKKLSGNFASNLDLTLYRGQARAAHQEAQRIEMQRIEVKPQNPPSVLYDLFGNAILPKPPAKAKRSAKKPYAAGVLPSFARPPQPETYRGARLEHLRDNSLVEQNGAAGSIRIDAEGQWIFMPITAGEKDKILAYVDVRDAYYHLYNYEQENRTENQEARAVLNQKYDAFVTKYGALSGLANLRTIEMDASGSQMPDLEIKEGEGYAKSGIFTAPVAVSDAQITTANDALAASLNAYNEVRLDYMASLTGKSGDETAAALDDKIYYNPLSSTKYEIAAKFLSGNVFEKMDALQNYASKHPKDTLVSASIAALERAAPAKIPFELLDFNLGERWIPAQIYGDFASHLFGEQVNVKYFGANDDFLVKRNNDTGYNAALRDKYAVQSSTRLYDGIKLMHYALRNTTPEITKQATGKDGNPVKVRDMEAIQKAAAKIEEIRTEFGRWLSAQPQEVKNQIADLYNRRFNCFVKAKYDGSGQAFPDLVLDAFKEKFTDLYASQKDAVMMLKQNGGGVIDHEVGGGKTLTMCIAAYEMKRLGLANRPMIIGLKANVQAIAQTYRAAYPNAKILYTGENDFNSKNRNYFLRQIKNNAWDAVIMTHEQFEKIPQSLGVQGKILEEELRAAEEGVRIAAQDETSKGILKGLERRKASLEAKLAKINAAMNSRKDNVPDFKEMGIDHIFVDESHQFKNLTFNTKHGNVAGLGNPTGSGRALNLLYAVRTIQERTGKDLGATFLSGTPISNSLTEMYLIFKYLRPKAMAGQNINSFDAWAAVYAKKTADYEFSVTGEIKQKERFRHFIKVPELAAFYSEITDFKTAKDIGIDRPEKNEELYNIPPTQEQQEFTKKLVDFAKSGDASVLDRPPLSESEDLARMLIATNYAKKMSLDMRLIDPKYQDSVDNKISHCANKIFEYYQKFDGQKGTQFVFSDLGTYKPNEWNVYSELKQKLTERGIPEGEIKFVHDAHTDKQRDKLFGDMNAGKIRVLIGSTQKLGTGVNAQERAVAVHHLDTPWRPSDLEQRNGRAVRAGNKIAKKFNSDRVDVFIYAVEKTLDAYKFNLLQNKQTFISQIKSNNLGSRTLDEGAMDDAAGMNFAEYAAVLSGNTDLLEKARLDKGITALEGERTAFYNERQGAQRKIVEIEAKIQGNADIIEKLRSDGALAAAKQAAGASALPQIKDFEGRGTAEIGAKLNEMSEKVNTIRIGEFNGENVTFGSIYDGEFTLSVRTEKSMKEGEFNIKQNRFFVQGKSGLMYQYNSGILAKDPEKACSNFYNALCKIPELIESHEHKAQELAKPLPVLHEMAVREWDREPELKALKAQAAGVAARIEKELAKDDGEQHREAKDTKKQGVPPVPVKPQEAGEQNMTISEKLMRFNDRLAAKDRAASANGVLQNKGKGL